LGLLLFDLNPLSRMRVNSLFGAAVSVAALVLSVLASPAGDSTEPEVVAVAAFSESNPFGHVVNGEKNSLVLNVENKSDRNVTLVSVAGSVHQPESNRLIKNLTSTKYGIPLPEGLKLEVPYSFYSEFKPGDVRLNVWLEHSVDGSKYRVSAYDSVVTIVEPEVSILDFKLVSTYLMVAAIFGSLTYLAYLTFVPQAKKARSKKPAVSSVPSSVVTATGASGYQEEWIPEHHLKKSKKGTSADELSGSELSGTEGRKRKGKK